MLSCAAQTGPPLPVLPVWLSTLLGHLKLFGIPLPFSQRQDSSAFESFAFMGFRLPISVYSNHKLFQLLSADTLAYPTQERKSTSFILIWCMEFYSVKTLSQRNTVIYAFTLSLILVMPEKHQNHSSPKSLSYLIHIAYLGTGE